MDDRDLTPGERVLIERRRCGQSQRQAADAHGISLYRFRRWESDDEVGPVVRLGGLLEHEVCHILRRRAGIQLEDLAEELGVSRWGLCKMEYGRAASIEVLTKHWDLVRHPWRRPAGAKA